MDLLIFESVNLLITGHECFLSGTHISQVSLHKRTRFHGISYRCSYRVKTTATQCSKVIQTNCEVMCWSPRKRAFEVSDKGVAYHRLPWTLQEQHSQRRHSSSAKQEQNITVFFILFLKEYIHKIIANYLVISLPLHLGMHFRKADSPTHNSYP